MINQTIIDYIKAQQDAGVAREQIAIDLQQEGGWTPEQIEEAFAKADKGLPAARSAWERISKKNRWTLTVVSVGFFLSVLFVTNGRFITGFYDLLQDNMMSVFAYAMLATVVACGLFLLLENKYLARKYAGTHSRWDRWMEVLVGIRSIILILNVIPFIQLIGIAAVIYVGWLWLLLYITLLALTSRRTAAGAE